MSPQWKPSYGPRRHVREIRERLQSLRFDHFEAKLQSPCLGAEIRGVDLGKPLSEPLAKELNTALVEFKVLFFREQDLSIDQHKARSTSESSRSTPSCRRATSPS